MEGAAPGGQDSGVETEGDQESNDSSLSSVSLGAPGPPIQAPPLATNSPMIAAGVPGSPNHAVPGPPMPNSGVPGPQMSNPEPNFAHPLQPPPSVTDEQFSANY